MIPIVRGCREMTRLAREWRGAGAALGFVPTMGALHEGHLSLVKAARARCARVVVSIFVNPLQFGPGEDLERYPRDLEGDREKLAAVGCDAIFSASAQEVYPQGFATHVVNERLSARFEGALRPGHFRGVLTVVAKLLHVVQPDVAFFGQKDAQQALVIRRMVADLNMPLEIVVCPTMREPDGLAMSSRKGRGRALALSRALAAAQAEYASGERSAAALLARARRELEETRGLSIDYAALVDPQTLADLERCEPSGLLLVAARVEGTRLIDNALLGPPAG
ncbi:MAG: pantoate--beta-alanine ligase [Planctomycetes bacterium]|nr:pantoate--beta-alanine ligase [Planctomycetota bacterium]